VAAFFILGPSSCLCALQRAALLYWVEARLFAALFGVRQADLPSNWTSFTAYNER
jgi:hypothetical protein